MGEQSTCRPPAAAYEVIAFISGRSLACLLRAMEWCCPLLSFTAALCTVQAIQEFANGVSSKDKKLQLVEGGYHEMLMGDERVGSADSILAWMRERAGKPRQTGGSSSAAEADGALAASQAADEADKVASSRL